MRRHDMLIKRIKEVQAAGLHDDPDVIAYDPPPSWVHAAVTEGWAQREDGPGGIFSIWRLTEEGKAQMAAVKAVGRPPLTLEAREARAKQRATDSAIQALRTGTALYGAQWLQEVIGSVTMPGRVPK